MTRLNFDTYSYACKQKHIPLHKHILLYLKFPILIFIYLIIHITILNLSGCAVIDRGIPVPPQFTSDAQIPGYKNIRYSIGDSEHLLVKEFVSAIKSGASNDTIVMFLLFQVVVQMVLLVRVCFAVGQNMAVAQHSRW